MPRPAIHPRSAILTYALDTLRDAVDVGGRVYLSRPNDLDTYELPAVCMYFTGETETVLAGSQMIPDEYNRLMTMRIDVLCEQPLDPDYELWVEVSLDSIARQVELAFFGDIFFAKRFPGYSGSLRDPSLLTGLRLVSVEPYELELTDRIVGAQSLTFELGYNDSAILDRKYGYFESYLVEIRKSGWDEDTVDPVLTSAEGDL